MSAGMLPERELELKSRCSKVSMVKSCVGRVPLIPISDNSSMVTSVLLLQVTPVQPHGLESVPTQLESGSAPEPWGTTAALNARRAPTSVLRAWIQCHDVLSHMISSISTSTRPNAKFGKGVLRSMARLSFCGALLHSCTVGPSCRCGAQVLETWQHITAHCCTAACLWLLMKNQDTLCTTTWFATSAPSISKLSKCSRRRFIKIPTHKKTFMLVARDPPSCCCWRI